MSWHRLTRDAGRSSFGLWCYQTPFRSDRRFACSYHWSWCARHALNILICLLCRRNSPTRSLGQLGYMLGSLALLAFRTTIARFGCCWNATGLLPSRSVGGLVMLLPWMSEMGSERCGHCGCLRCAMPLSQGGPGRPRVSIHNE